LPLIGRDCNSRETGRNAARKVSCNLDLLEQGEHVGVEPRLQVRIRLDGVGGGMCFCFCQHGLHRIQQLLEDWNRLGVHV
jgi:hypothetical protein